MLRGGSVSELAPSLAPGGFGPASGRAVLAGAVLDAQLLALPAQHLNWEGCLWWGGQAATLS